MYLKLYIRVVALTCLFFICFLSACATSPNRPQGPAAIAVWDLENVTSDSSRPDLGEILTGKIIERIKSTPNYEVVERQRLILALEELNVGSSAVADESTRLRVGHLIGARLMIFGGYQVIGELMRVDLRLVEVETGKILKASERTVNASDINIWMKAAEDAAADLL